MITDTDYAFPWNDGFEDLFPSDHRNFGVFLWLHPAAYKYGTTGVGSLFKTSHLEFMRLFQKSPKRFEFQLDAVIF